MSDRPAPALSYEPVPNVGLALRYTLRAFTRALNAAAAPWDLTVAEFRLLRSLSQESAGTHTELATAAAMDRPYVSALVKKMVARGMLTVSTPANDRRRLVIAMTAEGQRIFRAVSQQSDMINAAAVEGIAPADLERTLVVLTRLTGNLQTRQAALESQALAGSE